MNKELIIRKDDNAVDFALLKDGKLIELHKEEEKKNSFAVGDIFIAKIRKPVAGLNAAFVNVGYEKDAFLHYHDLGPNFASYLKFIKLVSAGKLKDFSIKNFQFEKEIDNNAVALYFQHGYIPSPHSIFKNTSNHHRKVLGCYRCLQ